MTAFRTAACALACALVAAGQGEKDAAELLEEVAYTLSDAIDKGLQESGEGVPFHAELEADKGAVVYSIDVAQGRKTCNVVLDAKEGKVVDKEIEDEDHSAAVQACKTGLKAAIDAAIGNGAGKAIEAKLALRAGKPVITVKLVAAGELAVVRIDGATGEAIPAGAPRPDARERFTDTFLVEQGEWSSTGANPYLVLEPGRFLVLEGKEGAQDVRLTITVLHETRLVAGVDTRVVEEREEAGGELIEVSRNYFAVSKKTASVYYFGEDVDLYRNGEVVGHDGAWRAAERGARFGLMMPGTPLLGARYCQEIAPGVAMDRAEIVALDETLETAAGTFQGCLKTRESTPLEKGEEHKYYAPGVG
ncbi:MAG: PepSY domain-containing protein, partial [Planctomycetota bacterium]